LRHDQKREFYHGLLAEIPFFIDVNLRSARTWRELGEYEKASNGYQGASYFTINNRDKRQEIDREWHEMVDRLVSGWKTTVKANADNDPALKKLLSNHSWVLLHSRRYAGSGYLQSAYSFLYETMQEAKHYNDVQILFDNGRRDSNFYVRMVVGQMNRVVDLGTMDFEKNPDITMIGLKGKNQWSSDECKAVEGHLYLLNVKDDQGNDFFVLFKAIAVEKDSKYFAFVWRRLPGGTIVKKQR
jgi:hypothetical protein